MQAHLCFRGTDLPECINGAKDENFQIVVFCQKGRDAPYKKFSRIADEIIVMNKFSDMASVKAQKKMIFN